MRCAVVGRGPVGRFLAERLGIRPLGRDAVPAADVALVFIAVSDRYIAAQATRLRALGSWALVHCSGATPLSALGDGVSAVWHPMRAFATPTVGLDGAVVGLRGESSIVDWLAARSFEWGGEPVVVDEDQAAKVHAACCFAAGFCAAVAAQAETLFAQAGLPKSAAKRAVAGLSQSAISALLNGDGLTGPARRGDAQSVAAHLEVLDAQSAELYRRLTLLMAPPKGLAPDLLELLKDQS